MPKNTIHSFKSVPSHLPKDFELFNYLINQIGDEVLIIGGDGRIVYANDTTVKGFGYSREHILKSHITDFLPGRISVAQWRASRFQELKRERNPIRYILDRIVKGPVRQTIEVTAVYFSFQGKEYVVSVGRDITKQLARQDQLRESEKMMIIVNFISGAAQEIEHPLRTIRDRVKMVTEKYKGRHFEYIGYKEFKEIMDTLIVTARQVQVCYDTTNRLLNLSRKKVKAKRASCDVNHMIEDTVHGLRGQLKLSKIKVNWRLQTPLGAQAAIDAMELNQIVTHLLVNAIQAMPAGGTLTMKSSYEKADGRITIQIKDEGVGISKENLPRVFDPFFTTKQRGPEKNSGLGLSIVYSILKSAGGDIRIESSLRAGTIATVFLPLAQSLPALSARPSGGRPGNKR